MIKRYSEKPRVITNLLSKLLELGQRHSLARSILDYYLMLRTSGLKPLIFRSQVITETIEISFSCVTSVTIEPI